MRASGVVWHACSACGRDWPFPKGHHEERDWRCQACIEAECASTVRACGALEKAAARVLQAFSKDDAGGMWHALHCNYQDPGGDFCNCGLKQLRAALPPGARL